jgi:2-polyprenyl-3-methyl-5-hydroxy-6-metoxy-1,4-benzoquinol methylase
MAKILEQAGELRKLWSAYQSSRVLMTANNYRVFDYLEEPKTAVKLAWEINTDKRATEILLDALTGIKLLRKQKDLYRNAGISSRFLVSGKPYYQGDIISHVNGLWDSWSNLDRVVKKGTPSERVRNHKAFILGMHNLASLKARDIIKDIDCSGVNTALDLGGGPGTYSIEMARQGIDVTLFDLPETIKISRTVIKKSVTKKGPVGFVQGDFLNDDIGEGYDLIFVSQIIHSYSEKVNLALLKKCRKALNKNGRVVIQEFLISEDRTQPAWSSLFAINMLVNTTGGRTYSPNEMKTWFLKAGFKKVNKKTTADGVLMSARI